MADHAEQSVDAGQPMAAPAPAPSGPSTPTMYVVRRGEVDDAPAYRDVMAGERVVWGTMQVPFPSVTSWRERLESNGDEVWPLVACEGSADGQVIGCLGLIMVTAPRRRHCASLGMAVRDDHQGRGVGTLLLAAAIDLADNWLQVTRIELSVYVDNEPALRLYAAFGFEVEGTRRKAVLRDGEYVDIHDMARLHARLLDA